MRDEIYETKMEENEKQALKAFELLVTSFMGNKKTQTTNTL